jgi:hypothetical protein
VAGNVSLQTMDPRVLVAYIACPLGGPIAIGLLQVLGMDWMRVSMPTTALHWAAMMGFPIVVAGISYPVTLVVGYPALYFLVRRREKRWWMYVGISFAIGLAASLIVFPIAPLVVMTAAANGLAFWLIGVKANRRFNADVQQASSPHVGQPQR